MKAMLIRRYGGPEVFEVFEAGEVEPLARVPSKLSWAPGRDDPGVGATAYEAFTVHAPLTPGTRVFINGGAGGVASRSYWAHDDSTTEQEEIETWRR